MLNPSQIELPICRQCSKRQTCPIRLMPQNILPQICDIVKDAELIQATNLTDQVKFAIEILNMITKSNKTIEETNKCIEQTSKIIAGTSKKIEASNNEIFKLLIELSEASQMTKRKIEVSEAIILKAVFSLKNNLN